MNFVKKVFGLLIVVLLVTAGIRVMQNTIALETDNKANDSSSEDLSLCLKQKDVLLYGSENCKYCQKQLELIGTENPLWKTVDCDQQKEKCQMEKITILPSWKINNRIYSGMRRPQELAILTQCKI